MLALDTEKQWEIYKNKEKIKWEIRISPKLNRFLTESIVEKLVYRSQELNFLIVNESTAYQFSTLYEQTSLLRSDGKRTKRFSKNELTEIRIIL